jgi:DinB superfamily
MTSTELAPEDLLTAARVCQETLQPGLDQDWSVKAGDLEWDCRRTLDHIVDTLFLYAAYLASRGTERLSPPRNGDPAASPAQLLATVGAATAVLTEVARAAPPGARAFHPAGMADVSGWIGMGCEEILLHTDDIARGLALPYRPPNDLCSRVRARLFPWAPADVDAWDSLRWAAGRAALPDRERLGPDWYWHCPPLAEWDGTIKKRTAPPAWR